MNSVLSRIWLWFWHLIPANPILVRVVGSMSKRPRHLWMRILYLGAIFTVIAFSSCSMTATSLSALAKEASQTFMVMAWVQLAATCFLAPIFTAGAITQEKDSQTFNILITTPLSNAQIVFGSLMSRLFFVIMLLVGGLPIFFITMIYGGVTTSQIVMSFAIAASTAILTGAIAIAISMMRVGTRRTIFSFYLIIAAYLLSTYAIGRWPSTWIAAAPAAIDGRQISAVASLNPGLALEVALNIVPAPTLEEVGEYGIWRPFLAYPHTAYVILTSLIAFLITIVSVFFVRRGGRETEATLSMRLMAALRRRPVGERRRKPRNVWNNPVAWREAATRASAVSKGFARFFLMGGGGIIAVYLLIQQLSGGFATSVTRDWLRTVVLIEFGTILILACNTAASAISREKESKTLDILLTTPVQARELVWGKLRGLLSFAVPLVAVPVGTVLLFGIIGLFQTKGLPVVNIESAFELALTIPAFIAIACIVSLRISLRAKKTVQAVMYSVGLLVFISTILSMFVYYAIVANYEIGAAFFGPFSPYTIVTTLVDQPGLFATTGEYLAKRVDARLFAFVGTAAATAVFIGVVRLNYSAMIREFDMTIRKQTGT